MAVYRGAYPLSALPGNNTYTPPPLPAHIPIKLEPVVGSPSNGQLLAVQNAMRIVESRGSARYIQDSSLGHFAPKREEPQRVPPTTQGLQADSSAHRNTNNALTGVPPVAQLELAGNNVRETNDAQSTALKETVLECSNRISSEITQLREVAGTIKELMSQSKDVLENMNRVLIATQRNHVTLGEWDVGNYAHVNPVNQQGITAV
ncbi:hypothetical protein FRC11_000161, partial [Ceratobasidium sp. 423]